MQPTLVFIWVWRAERKVGRAREGSRERRHTDTLAVTLSARGKRVAFQWGGLCEAQPTCWSSFAGDRATLIVDLREAHCTLRGMNSPNMSIKLLLCAVLAAYHGTRTCCGFNIDEQFPVIKEGKTKGSFFGFSVALHQQTEGSRKYL